MAGPRASDADSQDRDAPRLYLVGTPIGNLDDMSVRAVNTLKSVAAIACEDTRVTRKLLDHFGIEAPRLLACHDHNETASAAGIVKLIEGGDSVVLVSDAGMPAISDPGYRVVRTVLDAGLEVSVIPGPSSVLSALAVSGLPTDRFVFLGFPPRKSGKRQSLFRAYETDPSSLVVMESPQRLAEMLSDAKDVLGDRQAAVSLELTKLYERVHRAALSELIDLYADPPRGEATIVIAGAEKKREKVNKYTPDGGKKKG